ncbi:MAG TPA: hypothetical protein VG651_18000 [Stellaceae bacterium]|nr:hypothetical protein [Stellaceae bacterium]
MKFNLARTFRYYFPGSFEMVVVGLTLVILASPGIGMIFVTGDAIFPHMFSSLRVLGITWGCVMAFLGLALIFFGVRQTASPGTLAYRLTHPWAG